MALALGVSSDIYSLEGCRITELRNKTHAQKNSGRGAQQRRQQRRRREDEEGKGTHRKMDSVTLTVSLTTARKRWRE